MISTHQGSVRITLVHVSQLALHGLCRNHRYVIKTQRLEDILMKVVVKGFSCDSLERNASPINVDLT
jgi:hypothetical protein